MYIYNYQKYAYESNVEIPCPQSNDKDFDKTIVVDGYKYRKYKNNKIK